MTKARTDFVACILSLAASVACNAQSPATKADSFTTPPALARELRGVWVASVSNIDWPSKPGLSTADQQRELLTILDRCAELKLNAVILQVRPGADALYASELEPWSEYLTGEMGKAPDPYYDPLEFAVTEAHRRGLELHAWFNPYRARHPSARSPISSGHLSVTRPDLVRKYGAHLWMDPGEPDVREHTRRVILDVVQRYDIDAVHLDDYFYPYKEKDSAGNTIDFPDGRSWDRYVASGGALVRDDWRRNNVDQLVQELYRGIRATKPHVKFGISPFGIWRPGFPPQVKGFDAFAQLYADSRKWLVNGWLDYFTPQLYWQINRPGLAFRELLDWWVSQNEKGRHMWVGLFTGRVNATPQSWGAQEILDQIAIARWQKGSTGHVHFSMRAFLPGLPGRDSLHERLMSGPYGVPALVPATPWLDSVPPAQPVITVRRGAADAGVSVDLLPQGTEETWLWLVRTHASDGWRYEVIPGWKRALDVGSERAVDMIMVSSIDRSGNESQRAMSRIEPPR